MATTKMSAQEKEWKAESDMRTCVEYHRIMKDPARKKAAMEKLKKEQEALNAAASKKS